MIKEIQNGDIQFAQNEDCQSGDNGDADTKLECIKCADVGKVKHDVVEEEVEDKISAQNKEDSSSGQENLPAMGFVHYITTKIAWVTQFHEHNILAMMSMNDSSLLGRDAVTGEWFLIFEGMQCLCFQWSNSPSLTLECKGNMFIPNVGNLSPCSTVSTYQKTEMLHGCEHPKTHNTNKHVHHSLDFFILISGFLTCTCM